VAEHTDLERDLKILETTLRRLENEYTMFFAGQLPKPPLETRAKVEALLRRYDRAYIQSYADRFRLNTLQGRFSAFVQLWDRGLRAREEGRPGPYMKPPRETAPPPPAPLQPVMLAAVPQDHLPGLGLPLSPLPVLRWTPLAGRARPPRHAACVALSLATASGPRPL